MRESPKPNGYRSVAARLIAQGRGHQIPRAALYADYMASHAWEQRRARYFEKHGRACKACGSTEAMELHHRSYERFTAEPDEDLVGLCSTCHMWVHHLERTSALTLAQATDAILSQPRQPTPATPDKRPPALGLGSSVDAVFRRARDAQKRKSGKPLVQETKQERKVRVERQQALAQRLAAGPPKRDP